MKGKKAQNQITILIGEDGTTIMEQEAITKETMDFYTKLLGQTAKHMPVAKQEVRKAGPVLHRSQQL